jgi:hypothetical protein
MTKNPKSKKLGRNPFEQTKPVKPRSETGPAPINIIPEPHPEKSEGPAIEQPGGTSEQLNPAGLLCYWADFWAAGFTEQWFLWMKLLGAKPRSGER